MGVPGRLLGSSQATIAKGPEHFGVGGVRLILVAVDGEQHRWTLGRASLKEGLSEPGIRWFAPLVAALQVAPSVPGDAGHGKEELYVIRKA